MATPWLDSIRNTKTLTIYRGPSAAGWSDIFTEAIMRFNTLSSKLSLNVTFVAATTPPDPNNLKGTNVQFETADGHYSFSWLGAQGTGTLAGNANKGLTRFGLANDRIGRAFIYVPKKGQHSRFMKLCMTVHEMVHATGLESEDHSAILNPDIFSESLVASGDTVEAGVLNGRKMPPIWMSNDTAQKIKKLWP